MNLHDLIMSRALSGGSGSGASVQSDWNQNDETAPDYVKNRPFYEQREEIILTFDPNDTYEVYGGMLYKISNAPISLEEILSSMVLITNTSTGETCEAFVSEDNVFGDEGYYTVVAYSADETKMAQFMSIYQPQTEESFGADVPVGVYVTYKSSAASYVNQITYTSGIIHTIDEKYLPALNGIIMNSSTVGSVKKFRIIVDDSGTISATEVTA